MSADGRLIATLAAIISSSAILATGLVFCLRSLWSIRGAWDRTNAELHQLVSDTQKLVVAKEQDHQRLEKRDDRLESRMERHEQWHADQRKD